MLDVLLIHTVEIGKLLQNEKLRNSNNKFPVKRH